MLAQHGDRRRISRPRREDLGWRGPYGARGINGFGREIISRIGRKPEERLSEGPGLDAQVDAVGPSSGVSAAITLAIVKRNNWRISTRGHDLSADRGGAGCDARRRLIGNDRERGDGRRKDS